ncbi:bacterial regulatory helix-turn-helix, lysR family protein, partial [Vibrio parahaemolyticus AQ3810]
RASSGKSRWELKDTSRPKARRTWLEP